MIGPRLTYEFEAGHEVAWVVAHTREHAENFASSRNWSARGHQRFGRVATWFLCECDIDAVLDRHGAPISAPPAF